MPVQASIRRFSTLPLIAAALVWLASPGPAHAATINVTCTGAPAACTNNLNQIMESAAAGDTISVGPGTYTATGGIQIPTAGYFYIHKQVNLVSTAGPGTTILKSNNPANDYAVRFVKLGAGSGSDGSTLEGFTITNAYGGIAALNFQDGGVTPVNNITVKNVVFTSSDPNNAANGSHGILFSNVTNSRLDGVTVNSARHNGIYVFGGSGNVLTSNTVAQTTVQHAIALQNTTNNIVSGNTVTGSAFHAIILVGVSNSRIERNTLSGFLYDGITLTKDTGAPASSTNNFIGHNMISQPGWAAGTPDGTGIWLNGDSNGNYVFGNNTRGAPENGFAVFGGSFNYLHANRIHGNYEGGMLIWNEPGLGQPSGGSQPTRTLIRNNFVYFNPQNAMVNLRDTISTDVAFNHFWGANFPGEPGNPTFPRGNTGATYTASPGGVATSTYPSQGTAVYENAMSGLVNAIFFDVQVQNASVFRNKFLGNYIGNGIMDFTSITGSTTVWDAGSAMGGNFFTGFAANGNPSNGSTPFTEIYCPGPSGCNYRDNYPFAAETLGKAYSMSVSLPRGGSQVAPGSTKTISWESKGCLLVDIQLMNGASPVTAIATNYPDVGYFIWSVSAAETAGARTVRVTCKNSQANPVGVTGTTGSFTIATAGLTLLTPGPFFKGTATAAIPVAWKRGAGVTGAVNVYLSVDGGAETLGASGITGNFANINLPNVNSNKVVVRIETGAIQDSTDGYFSIVRTSGGHGISSITPGQNVPFADRMKLEWRSFTGTRYVDIEVFNGTSYVMVAQNVTDFGNFEWQVPASFIGSNRNVRITFKSSSTQAAPGLAQVVSSNFNVTAATDVDLSVSQTLTAIQAGNGVNKDVITNIAISNAGPATATGVVVTDTIPAGSTFIWASNGCLFAAGVVTCNVGTMAAGTGNSLKVVWRPTTTGVKSNTVAISSPQSDTNAGNNSSTANITINSNPAAVAVLRYRLYSDISKEHHFTTDLNEYNVLGAQTGVWQQEGSVGKVLNNPGSFNGVTAVPYYRLYDTTTAWHHWTTDSNEYYTLVSFGWWSGEGVDGWILPTATAGAIQLYRLNYAYIPTLHHWTIDQNEYNTLICCYGWNGEGGSGFVIQ